MDWIQVYYLVILSIGFGAAVVLHGEDRGPHNFFIDCIGYILSLPIIGRMFGWW